jgi:GH25 family lysozyme M1 (1,4-beta-N-acetylmuramidase)
MKTEVYSDVRINDFIEEINGDIIDNKKIDTTKIGKQKIEFEYINEDKITVPYSYTLEVVDETKPKICRLSSITVEKGDKEFYKDMFCGDNYDNKPKCSIEGEYDINTPGEYTVTFKAEDTSGNISTQRLTIHVKEKIKGNSYYNDDSSSDNAYKFSDALKDHKDKKVKVGIDVSKWQGDIDYAKVKKAGVEFAMIKIGGQQGIDGKIIMDPKFKENIKGFNNQKIPVGVYFFSHAKSKEEALKQAKWVVKKVKKYDIDLPIVFDWENWDSYQHYGINFNKLNSIANEYLSYIKSKEYTPMLYGSKSYLETIWDTEDKNIWMAHYTKETNYAGPYKMWQICDNGKVSGIKGYVDIDLMYE